MTDSHNVPKKRRIIICLSLVRTNLYTFLYCKYIMEGGGSSEKSIFVIDSTAKCNLDGEIKILFYE
jgi:hypothetical protein